MSQPKGKKSNNQKKEQWYCPISEDNLIRMFRAKDMLGIFDIYQIDKRAIRFFELDLMGFINRVCRTMKIELSKKK